MEDELFHMFDSPASPLPKMTAQHLGQVMAHLKGAHRSMMTARHMLGEGDYDLEHQIDPELSISEMMREATTVIEASLYNIDKLRDIRVKQETPNVG